MEDILTTSALVCVCSQGQALDQELGQAGAELSLCEGQTSQVLKYTHAGMINSVMLW